MRVIAGKYKGRQLRTVADLSVRPATGRVKGSVFNILQNRVDWTEAKVLDLFAGSGGLGIEALSRGARQVVFVENSKRAVVYLNENIEAVGGPAAGCEIIAADVFEYLARPRASFDVVFADPPYEFEVLSRLPSLIFQSGVVSPEGYLIIEHPVHLRFDQSPLWKAAVVRKYGRTVVTFFQSQHESRP
ncbi:MAG: 16S rRNA (guanine(966)-N(2))-methyltransferase RsmD [Bacteroidota bacterium]